MDPTTRRSFVRKSLATTVSITFAGLIRAHGEGGGGSTTTDPWGGTTEPETTIGDWATTYGSDETTSPWDDTTTDQLTYQTTTPQKIRYKTYRLTVWAKYNGSWTTSVNDADRLSLQPPAPAVAVDYPPMAAGAYMQHDPNSDAYINTTAPLHSGPSYMDATKIPTQVAAPGGGTFWKYELTVSYEYIYQ